MNERDLETVADIWLEASLKAHNFIEEDFWITRKKVMEEKYLPGSETFVYEEENEIQGFISLVEDTVAAVFVKPKSQGKGVGRELISKAMELRENLSLAVFKENTGSIEFYMKMGFSISGEQIEKNTGHPEFLLVWSR